MCSGCSGDYEGNGEYDYDHWGPAPASSGDTGKGEPFEWDKSIWPGALQTRTHGHERNETRNQRQAGQCQAESEYEVFVSADEIIEIRRIAGDFAGLR